MSMNRLEKLEEDLDAEIKAQEEAKRKAGEEKIRAKKRQQSEDVRTVVGGGFIGGSLASCLGIVVGLCKAFVAPKSELFDIVLHTAWNFGIKGLFLGAIIGLLLILIQDSK